MARDDRRDGRGGRADADAATDPGRGGGRGGGGDKHVDVESDPNVLVRYMDMVVRGLGEKAGIYITDRSTFAQGALTFLKDKIGGSGTEQALKFIGAWVNIPSFVKEYLGNRGYSGRMIEYANGFIDEVFRGAALNARGGRTQFNETQAQRTLDRALETLSRNLATLEIRSWDDVPGRLTDVENAQLRAALRPLTEAEQRTCRARLAMGGLNAVLAFSRAVTSEPEAKRAEAARQYMKDAYDPPARPVVETVIGKAASALKAVDAAAQQHLGVPDPNNDPVRDKLRGLKERLRGRLGRGLY